MDKLEAAKSAAAHAWNCSVKQISVQDFSSEYPWAHRHALIMTQNADFARMLIAVDPSGKATVFHDPLNIKGVSLLLRTENVKPPDGITPEQLSLTVRTLLLGPGGFVGSNAFWKEQKSAINLWTMPSPQDGPGLFQKYCMDPALEHHDGNWQLTFFYFNNKGGVEQWRVSGDSETIGEAASAQVVPDRKFSFPYG